MTRRYRVRGRRRYSRRRLVKHKLPTVVGLAMALEEQGVPSVAVHTHVFARLVRATAHGNGMPKTRQAFVPQPVVDKSAAELRAYVEGVDPVSRRPFMQEVIAG